MRTIAEMLSRLTGADVLSHGVGATVLGQQSKENIDEFWTRTSQVIRRRVDLRCSIGDHQPDIGGRIFVDVLCHHSFYFYTALA